MKLIFKHCGAALNELHLSEIMFTTDVVWKMRPLLSHLQVLELRDCGCKSEPIASKVLSLCTKLHSVRMNSRAVLENESFKKFLKMNSKLKEIEISHWQKVNSRIIRSIVESNPLIGSFKFMHYDRCMLGDRFGVVVNRYHRKCKTLTASERTEVTRISLLP